MRRSRLVAGGALVAAMAAGAVGGAVLGVPGLSGAQTTTTTPASSPHAHGMRGDKGALIDAAAKALNLTPEQLREKLRDGKTTIADVAKQQNVDVNTVIDAIAAADRQRISDIVNNPWPMHPGGPGGPGGAMGAFGRRMFGGGLEAVAKELGISPTELMQDLRNGQSIADIAKVKNVDVNTLIDKLVADATARIKTLQDNGKLSADQVAKLDATLRQRITDAVNGTGGRMGLGFGRGAHMGGRGFGGPMAGGTGGAPTA